MNILIATTITPTVQEELRTTILDWIPHDPGILILIGTLILVSIVFFIWAAFLRKPARRSHYEFHPRAAEKRKAEPAERRKHRGFFFRKHHRRRHREHRRNPTLAEAGGLPPVRSEEQPPASP